MHLRHQRHVRLSLSDAEGRALPSGPGWAGRTGRRRAGVVRAAGGGGAAGARDIDIVAGGALIARVRVAGVPDDEVAEVWGDVSDFAAVALAVNAAVLAALFLAPRTGAA